MAERNLSVDHTSVWPGVQRYAQELNRRVGRELEPTGGSWRVDETYVRVAGRAFPSEALLAAYRPPGDIWKADAGQFPKRLGVEPPLVPLHSEVWDFSTVLQGIGDATGTCRSGVIAMGSDGE
jgi:hypothetical protein